ncbi:MAG: PKD domain-containing protein [Flavobacteriales bacterium]|nr:PKD domain-containing protein [Flavobacteriales bacterium]
MTITNGTLPPEATYTYNIDNYCTAIVTFTDNSTFFPNTWAWDFGDGTTSTGTAQVTHIYPSTGTYTVTLVTSNSFGSDTMIQILLIDTIMADFMVADTVEIDENVPFQNMSYGASTYSWDFGDVLGSFLENPSHIYAAVGSYTVSLTVTNTVTGCTDVKSFAIYVEPMDTTNAIGELDIHSMISITPNPSDGNLTFIYNFDSPLDVELSVLNILGERVYLNNLGSTTSSSVEIDLSSEAVGVYMFTVKLSGQGKSGRAYQYAEKVIIQ